VFVVDTNLLVYACNQEAAHHEVVRSWLEAVRNRAEAWFLTWGIIYEFVRVVTHPRVFTEPLAAAQAWSFAESLLESPGLELLVETERHPEVVAALAGEMPGLSGNRWHDAHTAALMREHGVRRIATSDADFHRFSFLEPFDPVR
jgi:toxin-antitoxin system PIN domain toxin